LALPHYLLLTVLVSGASWTVTDADGARDVIVRLPGLLELAVLFAGVALLFTARYPRGLYDLAVGINRWAFRVLAYVALMTDDYPPPRLDQGGSDPGPAAPPSGRAHH